MLDADGQRHWGRQEHQAGRDLPLVELDVDRGAQ